MEVIIVGAGMSGLSAAISLRRCGHRVTIYERSAMNHEVGAAINVPPNAGRFMIPWGLDPEKYGFVTSTGVHFLSPTTMEVLNFHSHEQNRKVYGQPLYHAHRVDLHESLKSMAIEPQSLGTPVVIHVKSEVTSYNPEVPSITLRNGTTVSADLVIAADGVNSIATEAVNGKVDQPESDGDNCCYRFLISKADLATDPETSWINEGDQVAGCRIFTDQPGRRRIVEYSCRNFEIHNFVAICHNDTVGLKEEDWQAGVNKSEILERFAGFHPKILAVINKATEVKRWPLLYRHPVRTWIKGKMALAGDAAHPMLPHHGQGGAQGLEDGLVVGLVMNGVSDPSQIEERLALYEKIRRGRAASIQVMSKVGMDQEKPKELANYLEGRPWPASIREVMKITYGEDVLEQTIEHMTRFDPEWKLPEGFFPLPIAEKTG